MGTIGKKTPASALGTIRPSGPPRGPHNMKPNRELVAPDVHDDDVVEPEKVDEAGGRGQAVGEQGRR